VVVTSSLGRNLDPNRIILGDNPERVFVKSMSGGKIEDAHNFLSGGNFDNTSVTILIGTNNIGRGDSVATCVTKYKEMVNSVLLSQPSAHINLIELPLRSDRDDLSRSIIALNKQIRSLCDTNNRLHFIDLSIESSDLIDGLHLNRLGNHKLVTAIRRALIPGFLPSPLRNQQSQYPDSRFRLQQSQAMMAPRHAQMQGYPPNTRHAKTQGSRQQEREDVLSLPSWNTRPSQQHMHASVDNPRQLENLLTQALFKLINSVYTQCS
jgi:hypothetical protein